MLRGSFAVYGGSLRQDTNREKTVKLFEYLGSRIKTSGTLYLTGGASAVLVGWRDRTVDVDCKFHPEPQGIYEALQEAKEKLDINIELAAPDHFIPPVPGWDSRSKFVGRYGQLDVYHYDFYSQALAKIERGHNRDLSDVESMVTLGLIEREKVGEFFQAIAGDLLRYPSINQKAFAKKVHDFLKGP